MNSLDTINQVYGSDKVKYNSIYDEILHTKRLVMTDILEVGIYHGQSIRMWLDYFPNAKVYGIDNNSLDKDGVEKYVDELVGPRFQYWVGDGADPIYLRKIIGDKQFDVVIDDASHNCLDQVRTFDFFKSRIKPGGYYFCEDIPLVTDLTNWWSSFIIAPLDFVGVREAKGSPELLAIFKRP